MGKHEEGKGLPNHETTRTLSPVQSSKAAHGVTMRPVPILETKLRRPITWTFSFILLFNRL